MEWACTLTPEIPVTELLARCTLANLPALCADVYSVEHVTTDGAYAHVGCVWGEFEMERRPIKNGVRFALISCPNAFQWSITSRHGATVVHGSINQMQPDPEFAESIVDFMQNFCTGLRQTTT
ncbi:hypothetical protein [Sulfuriferula nivalis]|uniref:Uncharacterized protein n=1 Tax=Sulfuriferula nivalis TaxID=2675298 RepID=A0A809RKQ0_9PROT|nr:hypothetical protein [Sulfuriferula nivalis]BBO99340.1 hypothetical protein SFSGTM_00490 [Sulfuriferula nivalis]